MRLWMDVRFLIGFYFLLLLFIFIFVCGYSYVLFWADFSSYFVLFVVFPG